MKQHPTSMLLIEKQDMLRWRLVARETTAKGLSRDFCVIEENVPRYGIVRNAFDALKRGPCAPAAATAKTVPDRYGAPHSGRIDMPERSIAFFYQGRQRGLARSKPKI